MIEKLKRYFNSSDERSTVVKKNIIQSILYKVLSMFFSLLIVPLTIGFINAEQYGIWLTISSIVGWIGYFDLGLGHGLRNKYAVAKANGDMKLASKLLSTTYAMIFIIFFLLFLLFNLINPFIDWCEFLNVNQIDNTLLQEMMFILFGFFSLNMTLSVLKSLMLGDQRTSFTAKVGVIEQLISILCIYILTQTVTPSLLYLVFVYSGVPCAVYLIFTLLVYYPKNAIFRSIRPSIKDIDFSLAKGLLSLGGKFFVIQISLLVIFQCVNIIISRNCGQIAVTQYNIAYKYFHILYMFAVIILTPYWSAFTDAYAQKDSFWMKTTFSKLNKMLLLSIPCLILMLLASTLFFKIWVGNKVEVPLGITITTAIYIFSQICSGMHSYVINGIGKVTLQLVIYVISSIIAVPLMNYLSLRYGVEGLLAVLITIYSLQAIFGRIQIKKILNDKANGIWNR